MYVYTSRFSSHKQGVVSSAKLQTFTEDKVKNKSVR